MPDQEEAIEELKKIKLVGKRRAERLYENDISSLKDLVEASPEELAEFTDIGYDSAEDILEYARAELETSDEDDSTVQEEDIEEDIETLADEEGSSESPIEELASSLEEAELDSVEDEDLEEEASEEETVEDLASSLLEDEGSESLEDESLEEEAPDEEFDLGSEIESMMGEMEEGEAGPDMKTSKEIDRWLEEKVGIEEHIGEESVCPVCKSIVSIYDGICDTCGVEFIDEEARCGHCGEMIDSEMVECPECGEALVDEKTLCPICDEVVYASETSCPSCGAEFYQDHVRCAECKSKVSINSVICPECENLLREKIIEERTEESSVSVKSESTEVEMDKVKLEVSPDFGTAPEKGELEKGDTKTERVVYPFPAIVGQEEMKRALILNAVNPDIGGVLIEGQRGTAKSVAVRGLAEVLPEIEVVSGCRFSCDPRKPDEWCWECKERFEGSSEIPVESRPVRVVDLPLNATEDRVVGTLDVEKILSEGVKAFEEGILAEVNRGILYVDEINLLDDYIVDVLLDAAAMGQVTVEREDISLTYPSNFRIVGSMNPEEGALRPQLLDRLALNVKVGGLPDIEKRVKIINRREEFRQDPHAFREKYRPEMEEMRERIIEAKERLREVTISEELDDVIVRLSVDFEVDGHRADIIMKRTARTNAAWEGRTEVETEDLKLAAKMALPHRMKKGPLEEKEFDTNRLKRLIRDYTK